jgi:hypothetical protein
MKNEEKMKLVVDNTSKIKTTSTLQQKSVTNPIYGRYLEFTNQTTKKKITIRDFLNELFQ